MAETSANETTSPSPPPTRLPWITMLMLIAAGVSVVGSGVLLSLWWNNRVDDPRDVLRVAAQEFVAGRRLVAGELAETVSFPADRLNREIDVLEELPAEVAVAQSTEDDRNGPEADPAADWIRLRDFLVAAGKIARADEQVDAREKRRLWEEAIPQMRSSAARGFPPGREAEGHRLLGQALFDVGRYRAAVPHFRSAIDLDPTLERELTPVLARAQLNSGDNLLGDAIDTIEQHLAEPSLNRSQRRAGELTRLEVLIALRQWRAVESTIRRLLATADEATVANVASETEYRDRLLLLRSRSQIEQAIANDGPRPLTPSDDRTRVIAELSRAMETLAKLERESVPELVLQARMWSARARLCQGLSDDALFQLTTIRQQRPFGAEGIVATVEEIEVLAEQGRGIEMLQTVRYLVRELGDRDGFDGKLMSFRVFRGRVLAAITRLREAGKFAASIDIARSLPPVFKQSDAMLQEGLGFRGWAATTIEEGRDVNGDVSRSAAVQARTRYRAAGDAFTEASKLEFNSTEYLPTLWAAIESYQEGRHFQRSIELLESYLRYEQRRQHPRGLVALGRAQLAEGNPDAALEALSQAIIEFPRDPLRYDARLMTAQAYGEKGQIEKAKNVLIENLQDGELTPQSPAWRDSLLTLGELFYSEGDTNHLRAETATPAERLEMMRENQSNLESAVRYLDEAVARYWPLPRAMSAAYLSARTHLLAAQWPRIEAESPAVLDAARRALRTRADASLQTALDGFRFLNKHLVQLEEERTLTHREQSMLRNCLVNEADTLREMKRFEEAADAYRSISLRYMNEPPALEAILGQSRCMRDLGREREADALIQQAENVLRRIPRQWDEQFEQTTRYDRPGWEKLLSWLNSRNQTAANPTNEMLR